MNKTKLIVILLVVLAVAAGVWFMISKSKVPTGTNTENQNLKISEYSVNGSLTKVSADTIEVLAGRVVNEDGKNVYKNQSLTFKIDKNTVMNKIAGGKTTSAKLSDFKIGWNITVYTTEDPFSTAQPRAHRIEYAQ